jgi:hypothetical protein
MDSDPEILKVSLENGHRRVTGRCTADQRAETAEGSSYLEAVFVVLKFDI